MTRRLFFALAAIILAPTVALAADSYAGTNVGDGRYAFAAIGTIVAFIAGLLAIMKTIHRKMYTKQSDIQFGLECYHTITQHLPDFNRWPPDAQKMILGVFIKSLAMIEAMKKERLPATMWPGTPISMMFDEKAAARIPTKTRAAYCVIAMLEDAKSGRGPLA